MDVQYSSIAKKTRDRALDNVHLMLVWLAIISPLTCKPISQAVTTADPPLPLGFRVSAGDSVQEASRSLAIFTC
jgi:hypothetical protein